MSSGWVYCPINLHLGMENPSIFDPAQFVELKQKYIMFMLMMYAISGHPLSVSVALVLD